MADDITRIKKMREKLHWSQQKLAELAGVHVNTIVRVESGHNKPQKQKLINIMNALEAGERGKIPAAAVKKTLRKKGVTPKKRPKSPAKPTIQLGLSNIDLQLINHVLNMTDKEKINLLIKLGG